MLDLLDFLVGLPGMQVLAQGGFELDPIRLARPHEPLELPVYPGREGGGSLTYSKRRLPDNFELRCQWKVNKGSNSGVYYRPGQYEYQILDNKVHRDGHNPRTSAASLYFCMAPSHDATKAHRYVSIARALA